MDGDQIRQFDYEFGINIDTFQATTKYGISMDQLMQVAGVFAAPFMLMQSVTGAVIGIVLAVLVLIFTKPFDRLCGVSVPKYIATRLSLRFRPSQVEINRIVPRIDATIGRKTVEGKRVGTYS